MQYEAHLVIQRMWYCQLKILVLFPFLGGFHLLLHSIDHCLFIERYIHRLRKAEESMDLSKMLLFRAKLGHISFLIFFAYLSFSFNSDDPSLLATIVSDPPKVLDIWLEHDLVSCHLVGISYSFMSQVLCISLLKTCLLLSLLTW